MKAIAMSSGAKRFICLSAKLLRSYVNSCIALYWSPIASV
ncbi:hypothetical protein SynMITS9220_01747 [Synechococcus sp. MIT S9220]|nr:hypothetical protein SynMITS9220_01747 [Synechococcus sp. MIT S9220]